MLNPKIKYLFQFRKHQVDGVLLLRNGVFCQYARSATAVAESHHRGIDVQINVVLDLQVAVVCHGRQLLVGVGQGRE